MSNVFPLGPVIHAGWNLKLSLRAQGLRCVPRYLPTVVIWLTSGRDRQPARTLWVHHKAGLQLFLSVSPCQAFLNAPHEHCSSRQVRLSIVTCLQGHLDSWFSLLQECIVYISHVLRGWDLVKLIIFIALSGSLLREAGFFVCLNLPERGGAGHKGSSTSLAGAEDQPPHHHGLCVTSTTGWNRQINLSITVKIPLPQRPCEKGAKDP